MYIIQEMKSKKTIKKKIEEEEKAADRLLKESMQTDGWERDTKIRARNSVLERIYALKWTLGLIQEL